MMTSEEKQALKEAFKTCFIQAASIIEECKERFPRNKAQIEQVETNFAMALDVIRTENSEAFNQAVGSWIDTFIPEYAQGERFVESSLEEMRGDPDKEVISDDELDAGYNKAVFLLGQLQSQLKPN